MQKVKYFRCPTCKKPFKTLGGFTSHMETIHPGTIPKGWSGARYFYYVLTGKDHGSCVECKRNTEWNEASMKYGRYCDDPKCKQKYRDVRDNRMIGKYGKVYLLDDPDMQRKMLKARSISGTYTFSDGGKIDYVGSYEEDFLKMMDTFLHWPSSDIMGSSPNTYTYQYINPKDKENEGEKFYIPDFFIPTLNMEVEIKDDTTTHHKFIDIDQVKEACKDEMMKTVPNVTYLKLLDKSYTKFFEVLLNLKETDIDVDDSPTAVTEAYYVNDLRKKYSENGGFIDDDNRWNSALLIDNHFLRYRVETLVLKGNQVYLYYNEDRNEYEIPGGSIDPSRSHEDQAFNEVKEEAGIFITKPINSEISYTKVYDDANEDGYEGCFNEVYVAKYISQSNARIDPIDKYPEMKKNGKFYDIHQIYGSLSKEFQEALDKVTSLGVQMQLVMPPIQTPGMESTTSNMSQVNLADVDINNYGIYKRNILKIADVLHQIKDYQYGFMNGEKFTTNTDDMSNYKLSSPNEFAKNKGGVCWDYAEFQLCRLQALGFSPCNYYIELSDKMSTTHTFTVIPIHYGTSTHYVYIEVSFERIKGLYIADSLDSIFDFVLTAMFESSGEKREFVIYKYLPDIKRYGMNPLQFMNSITDKKSNIIKHQYSSSFSITSVLYKDMLNNVHINPSCETMLMTDIYENDAPALESLFTSINSTEYQPAQEGLFDLFHSNKKESSVSTFTKWKESIFGSDLLARSALGRGLLSREVIKIDKGRIVIKNLDCSKLISRIKEFYGEKRLDLMFDKGYNSNDWKRFQRKKINRSSMHVESLSSPLFFALELSIMFQDLYHEYRSPIYNIIAKKIYETTWLSQADVAEASDIDTTNLNRFTLQFKPYQMEFIKIYNRLKSHLNLNGYILAFEQGLGKTLTAYGLSECLNVDRIYIVCPNTLKSVWEEQGRAYYKNYVDDPKLANDEIFICDSSKTPSDKARIFITNNESISSIMPYAKSGKVILIIDESHNFRNKDGKRTDELLALSKKLNTANVLLMSGTPIKATPNEVVPALMLIDPLFTNEAADIYNKCFKLDTTMAMAMVQKRFGYIIYRKTKDEIGLPNKNVLPLPFAINDPDRFSLQTVGGEIMAKFSEIYSRRLKDNENLKNEFISLVNKYSSSSSTDKNHYINLIVKTVNTGEGGSMHELDVDFLNTYVANYVKPNIKDDKILARVKWLETNFIRMEQSSMGQAVGSILPNKRVTMYNALFDENSTKIMNMIKNNTRKTVIFSQFRPVVEHINQVLNASGIKTVMIVGGVNNRSDLINSFKADDDIQVIIATSQTMGVGVTLIEANQMFFFGPPWRSTDFDQCCDRIHRIGQTVDVFIYNIILAYDKRNLSSRMQDILAWSDSMFHASVDTPAVTGDANESVISAMIDNNIDASKSKTNPYCKINSYYHDAKVIATTAIPNGTLIAANAVNCPIGVDIGKTVFTTIGIAVFSNPLSDIKKGANVGFRQRIVKKTEYYDVYAITDIKKGEAIGYDASNCGLEPALRMK